MTEHVSKLKKMFRANVCIENKKNKRNSAVILWTLSSF